MGVSTFVQPDFTSQSATVYKTSIDDGIAVHHQIGGPFAPHEKSVPDMQVQLDAANFSDLVSRTTITKAVQNTTTLVAPTTNPRNDIVFVDRLTGDDGVVTGAEAASPVDPTIPVGKLPVARVNLFVGMTEITNTDLDDIRAIGSLGLSTAAFINVGTTDGLIPTLNADGGLTLTETDDGVDAGPFLELNRERSSPANSDFLGQIKLHGRTSTGILTNYGSIRAQIVEVTNGSEKGQLQFLARDSGSTLVRMTLREGLRLGLPSGADKGPGSGNFENGVFQDGVAVQADLDVPSQAEAEAGTATDERVWTAQRVSQAIAALGGGGLEPLASFSPVAVASVDITSVLTSAFKHFIIDVLSLIPANDIRIPWLRTSTNNSTFDAGGSDYKVNIDAQSGAGPTDDSLHSTGVAQIALTGAAQIGTAAGESCSFIIDLFDPFNTALDTLLYWKGSYITSGNQLGRVSGAALRDSSADVDAVQILFSSGNIESGEIRVYGVKES